MMAGGRSLAIVAFGAVLILLVLRFADADGESYNNVLFEATSSLAGVSFSWQPITGPVQSLNLSGVQFPQRFMENREFYNIPMQDASDGTLYAYMSVDGGILMVHLSSNLTHLGHRIITWPSSDRLPCQPTTVFRGSHSSIFTACRNLTENKLWFVLVQSTSEDITTLTLDPVPDNSVERVFENLTTFTASSTAYNCPGYARQHHVLFVSGTGVYAYLTEHREIELFASLSENCSDPYRLELLEEEEDPGIVIVHCSGYYSEKISTCDDRMIEGYTETPVRCSNDLTVSITPNGVLVPEPDSGTTTFIALDIGPNDTRYAICTSAACGTFLTLTLANSTVEIVDVFTRDVHNLGTTCTNDNHCPLPHIWADRYLGYSNATHLLVTDINSISQPILVSDCVPVVYELHSSHPEPEPECPSSDESSDSDLHVVAVVSASVGGIVLLAIVIVIIVLIALAIHRRRKKHHPYPVSFRYDPVMEAVVEVAGGSTNGSLATTTTPLPSETHSLSVTAEDRETLSDGPPPPASTNKQLHSNQHSRDPASLSRPLEASGVSNPPPLADRQPPFPCPTDHHLFPKLLISQDAPSHGPMLSDPPYTTSSHHNHVAGPSPRHPSGTHITTQPHVSTPIEEVTDRPFPSKPQTSTPQSLSATESSDSSSEVRLKPLPGRPYTLPSQNQTTWDYSHTSSEDYATGNSPSAHSSFSNIASSNPRPFMTAHEHSAAPEPRSSSIPLSTGSDDCISACEEENTAHSGSNSIAVVAQEEGTEHGTKATIVGVATPTVPMPLSSATMRENANREKEDKNNPEHIDRANYQQQVADDKNRKD